jgi:hypothetical protein
LAYLSKPDSEKVVCFILASRVEALYGMTTE